MSRTMYFTGDELIRSGHEVDYIFQEDLPYRGPAKLRRFTIPMRLPRLVRDLNAHGPQYDVVEVHEPLAAFYVHIRGRSRKLPASVIFSYGLEERSHYAEIAYRETKRLPISLKNRYSPLSVVLQAKYAVRKADHVICSNQSDVDYLNGHGLAMARLTRHHSGVESEFLETGESSWAKGRARKGILFVGSWLTRKGVLDLVPAIVQVLQKFSDIGFTVAGCGAGKEQILAEFPKEFRSRVTVLPRIETRRDLLTLYGSHAIFVLPSYFEGQPLVMIEAAAMGMAIVTTDVCGMLDFISDGVNGLFVSVGDPLGLAAKLITLVEQPKLAARLGAAAHNTARQHTWASAAQKIAHAYESAIGSSL